MGTLDDLIKVLGADAVSTAREDLAAHARDWWPLAMLRQRRGEELTQPVAVVRPGSTGDVAAVLAWADQERVPVVPYGGGSGVCGGAQAIEGAIALDLRRLDEISIDDVSLTVTAGAGVMGPVIEATLNEEGLTLGHFPQSIEISTVGGWLATRGAGQKSSRYGRIDDMVLGLEAVLPGGRVVRFRPHAGTSAGPELMRLFLGSEGTLGVITQATFKVHPAPVAATAATYGFDEFGAGLDALRLIAREGLEPAVARLYDETDATIGFRDDAPGGCVMVLRFEGQDEAEVRHIVSKNGGKDLGPALAEKWWAHRNDAVQTLERILFEEALGPTGFADTMEVSGLWPVDRLYEEVKAALSEHADVVGCHASHLYPQGTCLYFTFVLAGSKDDQIVEERYRALWEAGMRATLAAGGSITHHHGVGLLRLPWIEKELEGSIELLRTIKRAIDPNGIMNPGKLGL